MPMKFLTFLFLLALGLPTAQAQQARDAKDEASAPPTYVPPQRGAPQRRVGGSSRGLESALPRVLLLVPDHVGLTVSENPPLYWYLSKPTTVRVEVTLIDDKGETPLIEYAVPEAKGPAVHRIDLAAHKVQLKPGVTYQWSISVVPNPKERSNDVMSGGALRRVAVPQNLAARTPADKAQLARAYAAEGIWYDAIALYSELIDENPGNRRLRDARAALLDQVGLKEVAAFDRRN
jgi:hypothetical protein